MNRGRDEIVDEAQRLLTWVGRALIPHDIRDYIEIECGEYFFHKIPKWQGSDASLEYNNARKFIDYWTSIYDEFEHGMKKRYSSISQRSIDEFYAKDESEWAVIGRTFTEVKHKVDDIKGVIETEFSDKISEKTIQNEFKFNSIPNITASYIAWKNDNNCLKCKEDAEERKSRANKRGKKYAKVAYYIPTLIVNVR